MSKEKQIEEMAKAIDDIASNAYIENYDEAIADADKIAEALYNAGYRKQADEEIIDKIAEYFEKEDNWIKLKHAWNGCGKSVQLRDMLRDAISERR